MLTQATKQCKHCKAIKPVDDFYGSRNNKNGKWYIHSNCKSCSSIAAKRWRASPRGVSKSRDTIRLRTYGVTPDEYAAMLARQNNVCAICGKPERHVHYHTGQVRQLVVDHCHRTGRVRGLLCSLCNRAIALFDDDPNWLRKAADFLDENASISTDK